MGYTKAELLKVLSENKGLEVIVLNQSHSYDMFGKDGILVILK